MIEAIFAVVGIGLLWCFVVFCGVLGSLG